MIANEYDCVVIGSGAGGATVARELSLRGRTVAVVEAGAPPGRVGAFFPLLSIYDLPGITKNTLRSKEGVILWRAIVGGGTTLISAGNGVRCMEKEFADKGIHLTKEMDSVMSELEVTPIDPGLVSPFTETIGRIAGNLGAPMLPMPKMIDSKKCTRCGNCVFGCIYGAKWNSYRFIQDAVKASAKVFWNTVAESIVVKNGKAVAVRCKKDGIGFDISAKKVIAAAGGFGTPILLARSNLPRVGESLFMDLFVNVYAEMPNSLESEPSMATVCMAHHDSEGFILAPFVNRHPLVRTREHGIFELARSGQKTYGIMVKIKDDSVGYVKNISDFSKIVTSSDQAKLDKGISIATSILQQAGCVNGTVRVSKIQGAHPGGTCALGKVVDTDLQTKIQNLFICDASVVPEAPGIPPIVLLTAIGKWLGKRI